MKYIEKQLSFLFYGRLFFFFFKNQFVFIFSVSSKHVNSSKLFVVLGLCSDDHSSSLRFVGQSERVGLKSSSPPLLADDVECARHREFRGRKVWDGNDCHHWDGNDVNERKFEKKRRISPRILNGNENVWKVKFEKFRGNAQTAPPLSPLIK